MVTFMIINRLNKKGQLSIEFLLILVLILLIIQTIIVPTRNASEQNIETISKISYLESGIYKLRDNFNILNNSSDSKLFVNLYIPADSNIVIIPSKISFYTTIDFQNTFCPDKVCHKDLNVDTSSISPQLTSSNPYIISGGQDGKRYNIIMQKTPSNVITLTQEELR